MKRLLRCLFIYVATAPLAVADFTVFDGTGLDSLPAELYDEKLPIIYTHELFSGDPRSGPKGDAIYCEINPAQVRAKALQYLGAPRVVLNLEGNGKKNDDGSWQNPCLAQYLLDGRVDKEEAISRYLVILAIWRAANPDTRIGYYGLFGKAFNVALKEQGYKWDWLSSRRNYVAQIRSISRLLAAVDDLYPSAYWDGRFPSAYARGAEIVKETAHQLFPDKPVYTFIWFRSGLNSPAHQPLSFQFILKTMRSNADGVVLWAAQADRGLAPRKKTVTYIVPERNMTMDTQARQMQNRDWNISYKESQWMHALRDFRKNQE